MKQQGIKHPRLHILAACCLVAGLSACGGGGGGGGTSTSSVTPAAEEITFGGSVGDGPIIGATISVYSSNGTLLRTITSDSNAKYSARLKVAAEDYPLTIESTGGVDLVTGAAPDFKMRSVLEDKSNTRIHINPHSTLIVDIAKMMPGGLNPTNIASAHQTVMEKMNYGLDRSMVPNPITTQITSDNIATIVKSSEAIGEMVRRTRDGLSGSGYITSANDVMRSLAADLTDGSLDGRGVNGTNARTSAVANLITGQVAIEAMGNRLFVNGMDATAVLDSSIKTTLSSTPDSALTGSVLVNAEIIKQAKSSISAAYAIMPSPNLTTLAGKLEQITSGSTSATVAQILPSTSSTEITQSISLATSATASELEVINTAVNTQPGDTATNQAPTISGVPQTNVVANTAYNFQPSAADADAGTSLSFSITNRPSWANFNTSTGRLGGTPTNTHAGTTTGIVIRVSDGTASTALPSFNLTVSSVNTAPTISGFPQTNIIANSAYSFQPVAADLDGNALSFSITNRPSWASFNTSTGRLSGTPSNTNVGTTSGIVISVSDGSTSAALPAFSLTVATYIAPNRAPTISGVPPTSVNAGSAYSFQPIAADLDGDTLTFGISNRPSWASFNASTGRLSGTPTNANAGTTSGIIISVNDGTATTSLAAFSLTVKSVNTAPTISGSPQTSVNAGSAYSFQPNAADADGNSLSFSIANRPSWATFNSSTGRLNGTPTNANAGTTSGIVISVNDGTATTSLAAFSLTVKSVNTAPVISNSPATSVNQGSAYSYTPAATDADGDSLSFSIANRPTWATFSTATGRLSGTPGNANVGTTTGIIITVSDGKTSATVGPFSLTVVNVNDAPTITGSPSSSATEGKLYSFTPNASDADGNNLTFSVSNKPSWLSFNSATGQLSGVPSAAHVGTTGLISISVSDGMASKALPSFTITVAAAPPVFGSATLNWNAPTTREDGSALSMNEIGGYNVRYGTSPGNYTTSVNVTSAYTMSYTFSNLPQGTYYFVVTAYDNDGQTSMYSSNVSKTIQ